MYLFLVDTFKNICSGRLKELINRCYLFIENSNTRGIEGYNTSLICGIYTPSDITEELLDYQEILQDIGDILKIDWVYLIPIDREELGYLREQAQIKNTSKDWKIYLELQYIFSSNSS